MWRSSSAWCLVLEAAAEVDVQLGSGGLLEFLVVISWYTVCHNCIMCYILPLMWYEMCMRTDKGRCLTQFNRYQLQCTMPLQTDSNQFANVSLCLNIRQSLTLWICRCISLSDIRQSHALWTFYATFCFVNHFPFSCLNKTKLLQEKSRSCWSCLDSLLCSTVVTAFPFCKSWKEFWSLVWFFLFD